MKHGDSSEDSLNEKRKSSDKLDNPISNIDLTDDEYEVVQRLIRNKYKVKNSKGELVLKAAQKLFRAKENFTFKNKKDEPVFRVEAGQILDIAGDYTLIDSEIDEAFAVLEKEFTLFQHKWKIKTPKGNHVANISSRGSVIDFLRAIHGIFKIIPHKYTINNLEGEEIGAIQGEFSIKDKYTIIINDSGDVPKEALIAAAVTADALEGD